MKKFLFVLTALLLLVSVSLAGYVYYETRTFLSSPVSEGSREVTVVVPSGASFQQVAHMLEEAGLITNELKFRIYAKLSEQDHLVHAGEFRLDSSWPPPKILDVLTSGQVMLHKVQVPEGLTWWQTADIVDQTGLTSAERFSDAIMDEDLLNRYRIPASTAEGFLFPETYLLPRPKEGDPVPVVEAMLQAFWDNAAVIWPEERPDPDELLRTVIIASLVEKETSVPEERARVAGVYLNRLERGMRLQADPTTIYGLGQQFDGNLKRSHLKDRDNPYNTYMHGGLPPGPICSPGFASMNAVVEPEDHSYLYFVARGDGTHVFSRTLSEHNKAVYKYQILRRRN